MLAALSRLLATPTPSALADAMLATLLLVALFIGAVSLLHARRTQRALAAQREARRRSAAGGAPHAVPTICCPGGGVFFWWQIGAMQRLLELYELPPDVRLAGLSAGALAVVLGACGVSPAGAHERAFSLAADAGVFRNPFGLFGKWGRLVRAWLEELLPADAAERCTGRCRVTVTRFAPLPRPDVIDAFATRAGVVDALVASTHIPFFMDGRALNRRVSPAAADGGLLAWLGLCSGLSLLTADASEAAEAIVLSHFHDSVFVAECWRNGWLPIRTKGTERFPSFGAAYVEREAGRGLEGDLAALEPYRRRRPARRRGARRDAAAPAAAAVEAPQPAGGGGGGRPRRGRHSPARAVGTS